MRYKSLLEEQEEKYQKLLSSYLSVLKSKKDGYEFVDEKDMVWVLPFLTHTREFLIRKEYVPAYQFKSNTDDLFFTAISGRIEDGETPREALFRELEEEAGVIPKVYDIYEPAVALPVIKTVSARAFIFFIDIFEYEKVEAVGDGSLAEEKSVTISVCEQTFDENILTKYNHDFVLEGVYRMYQNRNFYLKNQV